MDASRWTQIQTLFNAVLEQEPAARDAFLHTACADDPDLLAEVRSLLAADANAHPLLDSLALDAMVLPADLLPDGILPAAGERVGPYRIVRPLGRGGMGAVFLAARADGQFEQQVALKLIRAGAASKPIVRRFQSERQILARLQHPHIARLLDGGLTEDGQPYFAMEYVDGVPLDQYCEAHDLPVEERVRLIRTVCDAVQSAHRQLVVHRDLKPSNILVTEGGTVKLLDFGIAKMLTGDDDALTGPALTQTGHAVMTPAYAAPEQVRHAPVTTATDVYALGVVLYELLAGQRPFDLSGASPAEVERVVVEATPEPPSTHAPVEQRRALRGDLDVICLKAMRKEPERRYASAQEMAGDLGRYLQGRPVQARPDTMGYRTRKFVQRYRSGVAAAAAVVVLIAALVGFYTTQLAEERDRARLEAEKAEQVVGFMETLFERSDPTEARGDTLTVREVMDEGATRIRAELADQPAVRARMMDVIAGVYQNLRLQTPAESLLTDAVQTWRALGNDGSLGLAESLNKLGRLYGETTDLGAAVEAYREALDIRRSRLGEEHEDVAELYNNLALIRIKQGNHAEAEALLRRAIEMTRRLSDGLSEDSAAQLYNLAYLVHYRGDFEEAEAMYRESLALLRQAHGDRHLYVMYTMQSLADLLADTGKLAAADTLLQQVVEQGRTLVGETSVEYAFMLNGLGRLRGEQGRFEEGEALVKEALTIVEDAYDGPHPNTATVTESLGLLYYHAEQHERAAEQLREALSIRRQLFEAPHPDLSNNTGNLALVLRHSGDYVQAEALYREALAMDEALYGAEHREVATSLYNIAEIRRTLEDYAQADTLHRRALEMRRSLFGAHHAHVALSLTALGALREDEGDLEEAERYLQQALAVHRMLHDETDHPAVRRAAERLDAIRALHTEARAIP
ncbi:MAG: tetratricopeptide repeat protein [Bacteroidetes bacterium]|jgi:serine/threonine-protein kinase|nr:tetratricopeptide repeat protein [Bacteroidota bacterium]